MPDQEVIAYFTEGQCNALAWEIHKLNGWSLGMLSDRPAGSIDYGAHVFVFDSDGDAVDIRGKQDMDAFRKSWHMLPYMHRFFSDEAFQQEMALWYQRPHYTRDREAKIWAEIIVDSLRCS